MSRPFGGVIGRANFPPPSFETLPSQLPPYRNRMEMAAHAGKTNPFLFQVTLQ
jgi:hypothetical protein